MVGLCTFGLPIISALRHCRRLARRLPDSSRQIYARQTEKRCVKQIAADALPPSQNQAFYRFPVKLNLSRFNLEAKGIKIPLKSGMAITTNLKLRDKPVISLVSDIFVDQTDSIRSLRQQ